MSKFSHFKKFKYSVGQFDLSFLDNKIFKIVKRQNYEILTFQFQLNLKLRRWSALIQYLTFKKIKGGESYIHLTYTISQKRPNSICHSLQNICKKSFELHMYYIKGTRTASKFVTVLKLSIWPLCIQKIVIVF